MKYSLIRYAALLLLVLIVPTSCLMEDDDVDMETIMQTMLDDWMAKYVPEATGWDDGYYTLNVVNDGTGTPICDYDDCWVRYNLTGYNLDGELVVTRDGMKAYQQGTFDPMTWYTPLYQDLYYDSEDYEDLDSFDYLPESMDLVFKNEDLRLKAGATFTMYIPYDIVDGAATAAAYFSGQFSLASYQPLRAEIEIVEVVADPEAHELARLNEFLALNGGVLVNYREGDDEDIEDEEYEEYNIAQESITEWWSNALDTVANVYIHRRYDPTDPDHRYTYLDTYSSDVPDTYTINEIDSLIASIVQDEDYDDFFSPTKLTQDFITFDGYANVWYIGRFLNGFIFDTNIPPLKEYITDVPEYIYTALEYRASTANSNYIYAWYYAMPQLRYGQWATIITSSTQGYGDVTLDDYIPAYSTLIFHVYVTSSE